MGNKANTPPLVLLLLNLAGLGLLGLGMAEMFLSPGFVPEGYRIDNYPAVLMVGGGVLLLPLFFWTMMKNMRTARSKTFE